MKIARSARPCRTRVPAANRGNEEDEVKQEYKKPQVIKVNLKVEQTVLAVCKVTGQFGPVEGCLDMFGQPCSDTTQPS